jgi:nucleoside-diphosphate-sugar epimerase
MTSKCLITGANGYIGSRLCEYFNYRKKKFTPLNRSSSHGIALDLSLMEFPDSLFENVDTIIHLAGLAHDSKSNKDRDFYNRINGLSVISFAKAASKNGVKSFLFISSVKAEENSVYGNSKQLAENGLLDLAENTDMVISIVRPSLVYSKNPTGNLKKLILALRNGLFPPPPEVNNQRSLIHLDDLCIAIDKILENNKKSGSIFIVTDNIIYSTRMIYEDLCFSLEKNLPSWSMPIPLVKVAIKVLPSAKKLFSDDRYDPSDLSEFGFAPILSLKNINESLF